MDAPPASVASTSALRGWRILAQAALAILVVSGTTLLSKLAQVDPVTAGFLYLIAVLSLAVWRGFLAGLVGSLLAAGCFNYFFFPPLGTLRIADPQNWVALGTFLIATTVASRLVVRERQRASEADARLREIEALYELCVELFTSSARSGGLDAATGRALRKIGVRAGGLVLLPEGEDAIQASSWIGSREDLEFHRLLERGTSPASSEDGDEGQRSQASGGLRNFRLPVNPGVAGAGGERNRALLVAYGTRANPETLQSVARLIALSFERERLLAERARLKALEASEDLKTSLLRAVSHDLSTPLTAILLSLESLQRELGQVPRAQGILRSLTEEATRLRRRIDNLLAMARLEAGSLALRREPTPAADLFRAAREHLAPLTASRPIEVRVGADCRDLDVDPSLALEILVNLIENADRASPPAAPIELVASADPSQPGLVHLDVLDRGSGWNEEGSSGDVPRRGLGLEIARSFARALGGTVELAARAGGGARARIDLPAVDPRRTLLAEVG
jgi:two-component system, OmpR family, sensor histidine kinase KdpD